MPEIFIKEAVEIHAPASRVEVSLYEARDIRLEKFCLQKFPEGIPTPYNLTTSPTFPFATFVSKDAVRG
jgi:hypothetical protein